MEKLEKFITQKINKNNKLLIMALTETTNIPLGFIAPSFELLNPLTNKNEKLNDLKSTDATVIVFMCNHCPYVIHVLNQLVKISNEYKKNVNFIGINSNDIISYPEDSPENMKKLVKDYNIKFLFI